MFTATLSADTKTICRKFMRKNPTEVLIENESKLTLHGLKQYYVQLDAKEKITKLMDLIDQLAFNQIIIFVKFEMLNQFALVSSPSFCFM